MRAKVDDPRALDSPEALDEAYSQVEQLYTRLVRRVPENGVLAPMASLQLQSALAQMRLALIALETASLHQGEALAGRRR